MIPWIGSSYFENLKSYLRPTNTIDGPWLDLRFVKDVHISKHAAVHNALITMNVIYGP